MVKNGIMKNLVRDGGQGHFEDVVEADDDILGPVEHYDGEDVPAEKDYAEERDGVGGEEAEQGYVGE